MWIEVQKEDDKAEINENLVLIAVYVNDLIIGCGEKDIVINIKNQFSTFFEITDKGELLHFLGMEI